MTDDDPLLRDLARAVDDGDSVDWASIESGAADESTRKAVRELAVIAAISEVHGSVPLPVQPDAAAPSSEPSDTPLPMWGTFRLLEKVGEGAHGEVYRAWDTRLDREVALKLLPADQEARDTSIIEEGRLLARVRHPNVVTIHGAERIEDRIGLWMEFVKGRTLEQLLEGSSALSEAEVITTGIEVCRAVSAVHAAGLLHRDIKAQNVMRDNAGRIALMDFGTGRAFDDDAPLDLAGTPLYLAPEVLQGQPATVESDIYSLGILLYHLVTGSYPVRGQTVGEIRRAHERGERTALHIKRHHVSPKLAAVVERAIDARPEGRYDSADALASDLAALKSGARTVRLLPTAAISIACVVLVGLGWEAVGRQLGSATIPSRLLGAASPGPVNTVNRPPVIAVLPFTNLSAESDSGYFADGLTDEIIRRLAGISGLRVLSATSSFAFRDQPRNLADVAARLGANLVVEGSVLRSSGRLQIEAQLVQIAGGASLWNQRFDRAPRDVFSIHDEIARSIADTLGLTPPAAAQRRDADLEAYDWHLRGRALVDRRGILNAELATELFQRAIARDPGFAPAYAGLANAYAFLSFPDRGIAFEKAYPIMRPAALEALRLDPTLAEAHAAMGWVHAFDRDWVNAEKAFQESIRLNPSLTQAYTSYSISTLQPLGRHAEALRLLDVAAARDPLSLDVLRQIGEEQLFSGQFAEAVETFQRVREVEPDFPFVQTYLARSLILSGSIEEALRLWAPGSIWPVHAYVRTGRRADAERLAADHAAYPYRMAVILTALGDIDRAAAAAEQVAANEPHRLGRLLSEPELTALRAHPRVVPLRKAFNLP